MKRYVLSFIALLLLLPTAIFSQTATLTPEATPMPEPEGVTLESLNKRLEMVEIYIDTLFTIIAPLIIADSTTETPVTNGDQLEFGNGMYLVPDDMKYGIWSFKTTDQNKNCRILTYSAVNTSYEALEDEYSAISGYFNLDSKVKMVEIGRYSDCTVSFYK